MKEQRFLCVSAYVYGLAWALMIMIACEGSTVTGPSPPTPGNPTTTTTIEPEPTRPPRVDRDFTWDGASGFSLFAGLRLNENEIDNIFRQAQGARRNTARVCAETEFWDDSADYPRIPRNLELLDSFLDTVARIPGAQILLMSNCTLKHGGLNWETQRQWNASVAKVARKYSNIAIEVVNEPWHPYHFFNHKEGLVRQLIREAHQHAPGLQVGADDEVCRDGNMTHALLNAVDFASFHPCRETNGNAWDPSKGYLNRLVEANGSAVLSETVAWNDAGDRCDHFLRTCDRERIRTYERRCERQYGCVFFFHSEDGLAARVPFSWMGR
jgi:hypothetical protein